MTEIVMARYQRTEQKENYDYTYSILEIAIENFLKGSEIEPKDQIFVRCWKRSWSSKGVADPGIHSQERIPLRKHAVEAYLEGIRRFGFDVLKPNGLLKFMQKKSPNE